MHTENQVIVLEERITKLEREKLFQENVVFFNP